MVSAVDVLVVHGMQEVSGSSPLSSTQVRRIFSNAEPMSVPPWGHSEGQDPSEAGRLTSDDAEIVSPSGPTALSRRSGGHQLRQGGASERTELAAGCGTLISCVVPPGEWWRTPQVVSVGVSRNAANIRFCR